MGKWPVFPTYTLVVHNVALYQLGGEQDDFACLLRTKCPKQVFPFLFFFFLSFFSFLFFFFANALTTLQLADWRITPYVEYSKISFFLLCDLDLWPMTLIFTRDT